MPDDISIKPSHAWRLAAFALMAGCCCFTGWVLGHAVAACGPALHHVAQVLEDVRDGPALQEFMARVSGS